MAGKAKGKKTAPGRTKPAKSPRTKKSKVNARASSSKAIPAAVSGPPWMDPARTAEIIKGLSTLHGSLQAQAKTPDQRADVGLIGLAQQHAEQGDHATVGSLLRRLSNWAHDHQDEIRNHIGHAVYEAVKRAMAG